MSNLVQISETERRLADRVNPDVTSGLALTSSAGGLSFTNATEAMEFAKLMALSQIGVRKHLRGNPGACLAIVVQAVEWRMSPYAVANKSYLVNDQIAYESQLVQAVILQRAPIKGRFKVRFDGAGDKRVCTITATLVDGDTVDYTSPEFGKITPKNSPLWKSDPDQQQFYYSGRALCRRHFPDVLLGVYAADEIEDAPRDPDRARDITPQPKGLTARLEALARPTQPSHDAETGEITEQAGSDAPANEATANGRLVSPQGAEDAAPHQMQQDAGADVASREDEAEAPASTSPASSEAKAKLMDRLERKAKLGMKPYKLAIGGLSEDEGQMLSDADYDRLEGMAEASSAHPNDPGDA